MSSLDTVKEAVNRFPFEFGGVDTFANKIEIPFHNTPIVVLNLEDENNKFLTNFSFNACAAGVVRLAAGIFLLPVFATFGAIYHTSNGLAHLGIALYELYTKEDATYSDLKGNFIAGIRHLIIAVYNLAISALSPVVALLYAINGEQLLRKHNEFHNQPLLFAARPSGKDCYSLEWAKQIVDRLGPGSPE